MDLKEAEIRFVEAVLMFQAAKDNLDMAQTDLVTLLVDEQRSDCLQLKGCRTYLLKKQEVKDDLHTE